MKKKAIVLLSGGLDSSVLLYYLTKGALKYDCYPLTILYGQRHRKELNSAVKIAQSLSLPHKVVDLSCLRDLLASSLTGTGDIPYGYYANETMKSTVVPNRNMILLSIAAGYAQTIKARYVAYAAHTGDHAIYPDCRSEFANSMRESIKLGTGWDSDGIELITPFLPLLSKADIVRIGIKLKVPFELTWSCYEGEDKACGQCGTCIERLEAFRLNNVIDPIEYKSKAVK